MSARREDEPPVVKASPTSGAVRRRRQAEALKTNLLKRKAQARVRQVAAKAPEAKRD